MQFRTPLPAYIKQSIYQIRFMQNEKKLAVFHLAVANKKWKLCHAARWSERETVKPPACQQESNNGYLYWMLKGDNKNLWKRKTISHQNVTIQLKINTCKLSYTARVNWKKLPPNKNKPYTVHVQCKPTFICDYLIFHADIVRNYYFFLSPPLLLINKINKDKRRNLFVNWDKYSRWWSRSLWKS